MTTPSKAEQKRPHLAIEEENRQSENRPRRWRWYGRAGEYPIYFQSEADAIFESLETELAVTRRALENEVKNKLVPGRMFESDFTEEEFEECLSRAVEERIAQARKERGQ